MEKSTDEAGMEPSGHDGDAHGDAPPLHASLPPDSPVSDVAAADTEQDEEVMAEAPAREPVDQAQEPEELAEAEIEEEEEEAEQPVASVPEEPQELGPVKLDWYILKVQSNREDSIADALQRRIKIAGLDRYFDEIIVPIEKVSEFKNGKKRVVKRKLYPGYIVVHMELNDDTWFLVRETPGIGDFTGSGGKPTPMLPHEVNKIVARQEDKPEEQAVIDVKFKPGDRVRINEGTFENFEGDVDNIDMANGRVTVMINIFGRSTPVELEYWQVENV